jgi:hypothetical protein
LLLVVCVVAQLLDEMFFTILTSLLLSAWVVICLLVYGYYYLVEVYLDSTFADQTPSSAHVNLKQLIEKVLQEVVHLPHFRKAVNSETVPGENERTYEELLATAVINKVRAGEKMAQLLGNCVLSRNHVKIRIYCSVDFVCCKQMLK